MKQINLVFILCVLVYSFVSCGKKTGNEPVVVPQNTVERTWNFSFMDVNFENTEEWMDGSSRLKKITRIIYVTEKNGGTCTFDGTKATSDKLTYEVNTTEKISMYRNDTLISSTTEPLTFTVASTEFISDYTKFGSDSLRMSNGPIKIEPSFPSRQIGLKLRFEGDKLFMSYDIRETSTSATQVVDTDMAKVVIAMQKK